MAKTYTTRQGDMWDAIAKTQMGSELYMAKLIEANPDHREVVIFSAGTPLAIPDVTVKTTTPKPPWKS